MTNFIPIFPLDIVVYPGENLNLHIFEPKYKQLIKECIDENKPFGIPVVLNKQTQEYGTLINIKELVNETETGEMDIRTQGVSVFRVLERVRVVPNKLYSGAIVNHPENVLETKESSLTKLILDEVKRLYALLDVVEKMPADSDVPLSYKIAHYIGLTKEQEYRLLHIFEEIKRLEFIRRHLKEIVPVIDELEQVKARIKMNGHFQNLSLGDFEF